MTKQANILNELLDDLLGGVTRQGDGEKRVNKTTSVVVDGDHKIESSDVIILYKEKDGIGLYSASTIGFMKDVEEQEIIRRTIAKNMLNRLFNS